MAKKKEYGNQSIKSLKGAERVRLRPAVIFGSDGIEGCQHSIFEIMSNSIDEAREGRGNKIIVTRFADCSVEVQDFGAGIPVDYNENEGKYNWELLFCEMYAGGKYDADGDNYQYAIGLNGLGLCATQYASEYMDAEIHSGGFCYTLHFEKGENVGGLKKEPYSKRDTGTRIKWKPDLDVFTDINISAEYFEDTIKRQAIVNDGVTFVFRNQVGAKFEEKVFCYQNGISDFINEFIGDDGFTTPQYWECERVGRDREDLADYKLKIKAVLCFSQKKQLKEYYHNSSYLEQGGSPDKAFRSAFVAQINAYLKANNKYNKTDSQINVQDIEDVIVFIVSSFSTQTSYANQTKKAITNKFIQDAMNDFFRKQLEIYFIENKVEADKIADQILINMRSRVKAENTRKSIKNTLQNSKVDMTNRIQKFVDCRSKDVNEREVFIVEGDSALGACKQARDANFQAIMPVRGKILNCLKCDYDKIFKSEIITDLIKILGCGVEVRSKASKDLSAFDMDNLRWNKILICTDADVDGFQIRTLILTMIYRLMPKLIEEGKVYIAESPLYEVQCKEQTYFAYNEVEMDKIKEELDGQKYTVQRSKGLGENEAEMMALTTMNPATRRLILVTPDEAEKMAEMFELLLGDNLEGRKQYITDFGHEYIDAADVS